MKTFFALIISLIIPASAFAQWLPDIRISNNPSSSYPCFGNARGVAAETNNIHVTWFDQRDGNREIYYRRSTDAGISWGSETRLTNDPGISETPCITVTGSTVHIIWKDSRDGNEEIYYKRSTDAGVTWQADTRLTNSSGFSYAPSLASSGKDVYITWYDVGPANNVDIYFKRSTNMGSSWEPDMRLTTHVAPQYASSVSAADTMVHVIWHDTRGGNQIYYRGSTDRGVTWGNEMLISPGTSTALEPSLSSWGQTVHASWKDERDGNMEIYYSRSTNGGINWGSPVRVTNSTAQSWYPAILASGQKIHLVWMEMPSLLEIYYKYSTDAGATWNTHIPLTSHTFGGAQRPSIAGSGPSVHTIWLDTRNGNEEVYYRGNPTGITAINILSSEVPSDFSLAQNYPNPFNPVTDIEFQVADFGFVKLGVYDITGKELAALVNRDLNPGIYRARWDASGFTSGVYFYRLETKGFTETKKALLLK
jgi:Neuraminidase (sialidase)